MGHPVYLIKKRIYILYVDAFAIDTKGMSRKIFFDAIYKKSSKKPSNEIPSKPINSYRSRFYSFDQLSRLVPVLSETGNYARSLFNITRLFEKTSLVARYFLLFHDLLSSSLSPRIFLLPALFILF